MTTPTASRIGRPSKRRHFVIVAIIPATLLMLGALLWSMQRCITLTQSAVAQEFTRLLDYVGAQEQFLHHLALRARSLPAAAAETPVIDGMPVSSPGSAQYIYQIQSSPANIPYAVICATAATCLGAADHHNEAKLQHVGDFLADFYAAYWASNEFPGPPTLLTDAGRGLSLSVPAFVPQATLQDPLSARNLSNTLGAMVSATSATGKVEWLAAPGQVEGLIGVSTLTLPAGRWPNSLVAVTLPVATFFHLRANTPARHPPAASLQDAFLLAHQGQALIGLNTLPQASQTQEIRLSAQGALFLFRSPDQTWSATYRVPYLALFRVNPWLPLGTALLLLLSIGLTIQYVRWYRRRIVAPLTAALDAQQEQDTLSQAMLATAPLAVCIIGRAHGEILFTNDRAQEWLQTRGLTPLPWPPAMFQAQGVGQEDRLLLCGRYAQLRYAPMRYQQQDALLCVFTDISRRVQEEAGEAQARRDADEANAAKSRFLAAMSHHLRTPLYSVQGTLDVLAGTPLADNQRHYLTRAQDATDSLLRLINDILDVRKIETGELTLSPHAFDPSLLLQQCVDHFAAAARAKGLLIFACIDTDVPASVRGDPARLQQVLFALLDNALSYTDAGQIVARLRCERSDPATQVVLTFQVADSGTGMSPETQDALTSLFRLPRPYFQTATGAGLGLAISASLVQMMQGEIRVTSEAGLGSSFSVCLTLPVLDAQTAAGPELDTLALYVRSPHAELTQNLCQWLRLWGAQADPFHSDAAQQTPARLLLDVSMPPDDVPAHWPGRYACAGMPAPTQAGALVIEQASIHHIGQRLQQHLLQPTPSPQLPQTLAAHLRVLIAEDHPVNRATLRDQLEQLGCQVTAASDGADALHRWALAPFDLVLTDLNMPALDGYDLCKALRDMGVSVPVIGITASPLADQSERCQQAGLTRWFVKPVSAQTLRACLLEASQHIAPEAPADAAPTAAAPPSLDPLWIEELQHIPAKYHTLFRDTMSADAHTLRAAVQRQDLEAIRQSLHRIHGALLAMKQTHFAAQLRAAEHAVQLGDHSPAMRERADSIALQLLFLIEQHLPA